MISRNDCKAWIITLFGIVLLLQSIAWVQAANYVFPGNLPSGCSGSNGAYTCNTLSLAYGDTIAIASPKPASITVNGDMTTNTSTINSGGLASDLMLVVTGTLKADYLAKIQANVNAGAVSDTSGYVTFGGALSVDSGSITLSYRTTVAGDVSSISGTINIGQNNVVGGDVASTTGEVIVGYGADIKGDISTGGAITLGQNADVSGKVTGSTGNVTVGYSAKVEGGITTSSGSITIGQYSEISACVASTSSAAITLSYKANVNRVCCGSNCGTSCVINNSQEDMPSRCEVSTTRSYFPVPIPFDALNADITSWSNGSVYAGKFNGTQTLAGIPFNLQTDSHGHNVFWGSNLTPWTLRTTSSLTLTLDTNLYGATKVYTLINTAWGVNGSNVGSITFNADNGDKYTVQLVVGKNVRDHYYGSFSNTLSSENVTRNVIGNNTLNTAHLDMQSISLPESFKTKTLTSIDFTSTGGPNTGLPFLAGVTVRAERLGGSTTVVAPSSFNCVEVGAAINGDLYTKLTNTAFNFDVVALKSDGSIQTAYAGNGNKNVTVELVDGSGDTDCKSRAALSPSVSQSLTFTAAGSGRKTSNAMTITKAYANVRCRVTDANQTPSTVGCSTDNFAIRPTDLTLASSNANADSNGSSASALPVVKTGAVFSLTATATPGYDGTPAIDQIKLLAHSGAKQIGTLSGEFSAADPATGIAVGNSFAYSEVGYFGLDAYGVYDDSFTSVDSANGDCTADFSNTSVGGMVGCKFGNSVQTGYFGRFIPDHLQTQVLSHGSFAHACSTFSYNGQTFRYATSNHPMLDVYAYNASMPAAVTKNYTGKFARLQAGQFTWIAPATDAVQKGADNSNLVKLSSNLATPLLTDNGILDPVLAGKLTLTLGDDSFAYQREANAMIAPFNNAVAINVAGIADSDGVTATGLPMALIPSGETIRYGRINMMNANGSELADLNVPMTAEYFDGKSFVTSTDDRCSVATISITDALNSDGLLPADTCIWDAGSLSGSAKCGGTAPGGESYLEGSSLSSGSFNLYLKASSKTGSLTVNANVDNWMKFNWTGAGLVSPSSTATFGIYKGDSKQIYLRELY